MQSALPYQIDIQGPCTYAHDFTTQFTGEVCAASLGKMENSRMLPETVRDVTGAFTDKYLFNWPWGTQMKAVEVPEGPHKLTIFVINRYRMMALKPCPNADGLVMDHCSAAAFDRFFGHMVEPLVQRLGDDLGSLFCDSIECDGHNWSGVLLEEFEKRRGYSLKPYIYALWGDMGEATGDIRYDYFRTMSELTIENFFSGLRLGARSGATPPASRRTVHGEIFSRSMRARIYRRARHSASTTNWSATPFTAGLPRPAGIFMGSRLYQRVIHLAEGSPFHRDAAGPEGRGGRDFLGRHEYDCQPRLRLQPGTGWAAWLAVLCQLHHQPHRGLVAALPSCGTLHPVMQRPAARGRPGVGYRGLSAAGGCLGGESALGYSPGHEAGGAHRP